jgi:hypothetical protein
VTSAVRPDNEKGITGATVAVGVVAGAGEVWWEGCHRGSLALMPIRFTVGDTPFSARERDQLGADLEELGADERVLDAYEATLSVRSRLTRPGILRMLSGDQVKGAALVVVCRDSGTGLFAQPAARRAMQFGPPIWYWERTGVGTDSIACPGLVAPGVDREGFVAAAVSWLSRRYALGAIMERAGQSPALPHTTWPWVGVTTLSPDEGTRRQILGDHRNLERKVRRFANRGGTVQRLTGPMPDDLRSVLARGYALPRPPDPPFRELYEQIVDAHWSVDSEDLVHLVAHVGQEPVGYHSFLRSGRTLALLSGVFDRPEGGTHHAYENVLLDSIDLAVDLGCTRIEYGPAINAVKASLLDVEPTEIHFVSRIPGMTRAFAAVLPRTALAATGARGEADPSPIGPIARGPIPD